MSLWPTGIKIDVIGVTGPYASGKTLFALTIDPKSTLYYDFEKSGGVYMGLGCERIDAPAEMLAAFPNGFRPVDVFNWWLASVRQLPSGKYRVIVLDTIGDVEAGLADYVKARHKDYGFSSPEKFEALGGIFWKAVRDEWKSILTQLASKCETFCFTAHLRTAWKHGKPTESKEPVGKQTLFELASLYLWLGREERGEGNVIKTLKVPFANTLKSRLARTAVNEDGTIEIAPLIPPRLPECTPAAIRDYIANPRDFARLKKDEKKTATVLSDDERLAIEAQKAEDERAAAESRLEMARMTQRAHAAIESSVTNTTEAKRIATGVLASEKPAKNAERTDAVGQPKQEAAAGGFSTEAGIAVEQLKTIAQLKPLIDDESYRGALKKFEASSAKALSYSEADRLIAWLQRRVESEKKIKEDGDHLNDWAEKAIANKPKPVDDDIPF